MRIGMLKRIGVCFSFFIFLFSFALGQSIKADTSLSAEAIKVVLQGVWGGPDESYYFLFRGDSAKEWEAEGTDSAAKPYCSFTVSKTACDSASAHVEKSTGFFLQITCTSPDNTEERCYYIQSVNALDLKIGYHGKFEESGHFKKIKRE
jgi:hypothetical protein